MEPTIRFKPFDLNECMTKHKGRCVTRDGRPARVVCTDYKSGSMSPDDRLLVLIDNGFDEREEPITYREDGSYDSRLGESPADLFLPVQVQTVYYVISASAARFKSRLDADRFTEQNPYLKTVEVIEEIPYLKIVEVIEEIPFQEKTTEEEG